MEHEIFIGYDYNGVLEKQVVRNKSFSQFSVINSLDPNCVYKLISLAMKYDAKLFCISDLSLFADFNRALIMSLVKSSNPIHSELGHTLRKDIPSRKKFRKQCLSLLSICKQDRIDEVRKMNKDSLIISFEDSVSLTNCNQVWVNSSSLLTDENCQSAENIILGFL